MLLRAVGSREGALETIKDEARLEGLRTNHEDPPGQSVSGGDWSQAPPEYQTGLGTIAAVGRSS
jgi:hypothetical protein